MPTVPLWIPIVMLSAAALLILVLIVLKIGSLNAQSPIDRWREAAPIWADVRRLKKEKLIVPEDAPRRLRLGWVDSKHFVKTANMRSLLVMAPSGSGKTPRVVVPNVLTHEGPAIVASVKADVLQLTQAERERRGNVWIFDPTNATGRGNVRWTPLMGIETYGDALRNAKWLCESSKSGGGGDLEGQQYWDTQGTNAIAPCLLLAARTNRGMDSIAQWIHENRDDVVAAGLDSLGTDERDAKGHWRSYTSLEHRTRSSVAGTANVIIEAWTHPDVAASTTMDPRSPLHPLDVNALLSGNNTLYLVAPASEQSRFIPIFETVLNATLRRVEMIASQTALPMEPPLLLALDEAANIAPLKNLDKVASKAANEGVLLMSVWQDYSQIEKVYGRESAKTVLSNHWAELYLPGISDESTLRHITTAIGTSPWLNVTNQVDAGGQRSHSARDESMEVAPASWLRQRPSNEVIVLCGSVDPMRLTLPGWFEDPSLRAMVDPAVAARFDAAFNGSPTRTNHAAIGTPTGRVVDGPQLHGPSRPTKRAVLTSQPAPVHPLPSMIPAPAAPAPAAPPAAARGGKYASGYQALVAGSRPSGAAPSLQPTPASTPIPATKPVLSLVPPAPASPTPTPAEPDHSAEYDDDSVMSQACRLVVTKRFATTGVLCRELNLTEAEAGEVLTILEQAGVVGKASGPFPRPILVSVTDLAAAQTNVRRITGEGTNS